MFANLAQGVVMIKEVHVFNIPVNSRYTLLLQAPARTGVMIKELRVLLEDLLARKLSSPELSVAGQYTERRWSILVIRRIFVAVLGMLNITMQQSLSTR